ncbi:hypothetical protein BOX15_Mlig000688g2, partial [Macrostomum lignano]
APFPSASFTFLPSFSQQRLESENIGEAMMKLQLMPQLAQVLALLIATSVAVATASPSSDALTLRYVQQIGCPLHRSLRVQIDDSRVIVTLQLLESSEEFLHSSERAIANTHSGEKEGQRFESLSSHRQQRICFYQGNVEPEGSLAVVKQRNGLISGSFHYGNRVYEIPEQPAPAEASKRLLRASPLASPPKATCGVSNSPVKASPPQPTDEHQQLLLQRSRRALKLDTNSNYSESDRKYIQIILVGDEYFYRNQSSDMVKARDRLWEIGNYVNALYKQIGVNVITVHTEAWTTDPYTLYSATSPTGANSSEQLDRFMEYRMRHLSFKTHAVAHLVTGLKYSGTDVGLAHLGKLCTFGLSGGVNSDRDPNAYGVAVTLAHELGHNLGLNHDEDERGCGTCPDPQGCIMAAVGNEVNPVRFSNCSIHRFLDFTVPNGLGYCMTSPPEDSAVSDAKVTCGNRIVEAGEECDCGPVRWCNNTCCNPNTCRFTSGSACASGECCNLATCQLKSQGVVCRSSRGICDLPEYCNGSSEWCPQFDDYKADGTECLTGKAYCYKGRCDDRDTRCAALFNGTNFRAAEASWSVGTTQGLRSGYCSYNESSLHPINYTFTACTAANQRCGLLYCVGGNIATALPIPKWKGLEPADTNVLDATISGQVIVAAYAMHNLKYSGYRDPGLVPNGAECGSNMMCVNSQCMATSSVSVSCPSCNGRGSCAQSAQCFCDTGYRPPDCLQAGGGGSLMNRLPGVAIDCALFVDWGAELIIKSIEDNTTAPTSPVATTTTVATRSNASASRVANWLTTALPLFLLSLLLKQQSALVWQL